MLGRILAPHSVVSWYGQDELQLKLRRIPISLRNPSTDTQKPSSWSQEPYVPIETALLLAIKPFAYAALFIEQASSGVDDGSGTLRGAVG